MALPTRHASDGGSEVARWDPFHELGRFRHQLGTYFDPWRPLAELATDAFTPLADIEELDDAYLVEIELPGVQRDHVDIDVTARRLTVRGERREKERVGILRRRERTVGRFSYEVVLPDDIDEDAVEAHLDNGVLTVRLPKPEHRRRRRISVN